MRIYKRPVIKIIVVFSVFVLSYYFYTTSYYNYDKENVYKNVDTKVTNIQTAVNNHTLNSIVNIWCIFTKVIENAPLRTKFHNLITSLYAFSTVPIHLHIICDNKSKDVTKTLLDNFGRVNNINIIYFLYDFNSCVEKINDIVEVLTPHFSSNPGTYYSDALFYLSLGLYRIASTNLTNVLLLDIDVQFNQDVLVLYKEFDKFQLGNLFGLAHEQSPVYRHVLYTYRSRHKTTFGDYIHTKLLTLIGNHQYGFPGYNSGVLLLNLSAIRESTIFLKLLSKDNVKRLVDKYSFRGHLGDQDFYTILGYEYPEFFWTLSCSFNRQLCVWWRDHGYSDVFSNYWKCDGDIVIYHNNCNTRIAT